MPWPCDVGRVLLAAIFASLIAAAKSPLEMGSREPLDELSELSCDEELDIALKMKSTRFSSFELNDTIADRKVLAESRKRKVLRGIVESKTPVTKASRRH